MSNEQLRELQDTIASDRKVVELGESLNRLRGNRDFQRLVLEGYFKDEAVRLVLLKSDPSMQTAEKQASIVRDLDAIGSLHQYLNLIGKQADIARRNIESTEREIESLENEVQ